MADGYISINIRLVPDEESIAAILTMLNLWQENNPDRMIAMVPDKDKYKYEIINMEKNDAERK